MTASSVSRQSAPFSLSALTTATLEVDWEVKRQYPDVIILFRLGDFYEVFGQDAQQATEAPGVPFCSATIQNATATQAPTARSYFQMLSG